MQEVARGADKAYWRAMLARLFLVLLLAAFAVPAAAAPPCHGARAATASNHAAASHHEAPAPTPDPGKAAVAHVCIGCVPLGDRMTSVARRALSAAAAPDASVARIDLGGSSAPALPPPRIG